MKKTYTAPQMTVARFDVAEQLTQSGIVKEIKCIDSCYWFNQLEVNY